MALAAIYARISSDPDDTQLGVKRQLTDCRALAARKGWNAVREYVDNDVSASTGNRRPAYRQMLEDIKAGEIDAVVAWADDRLHRQPMELEEFFEITDAAGIKNLATVSGDLDLSTEDGKLKARILGAVAANESAKLKRRIQRKHEELAAAGKDSGGGHRPFGFNDDRITLRTDEAAIIRELAARILAGDSIRSICQDLDDRKISTVTGSRWTPHVVRRMLMSPRISGQRQHHGEIVGPAEWPAIVTPTETARLRSVLGDPSRRTNRVARRYLLAGTLRCSHCGATLVARPKADGRRAYVCAKGPGHAGCGKTSTLAADLEVLIVEAVLYRLDTPALANRLARQKTQTTLESAVSEGLALDQARLEELAELYADRTISKSEWLTARRRIEDRITGSKRKLSRMTQSNALDGFIGNSAELRRRWSDLTLSRQKAIVDAVLDHVVVGPALKGRNQFDPNRFKPTWRR
jgi:site-specific DNA recombinase